MPTQNAKILLPISIVVLVLGAIFFVTSNNNAMGNSTTNNTTDDSMTSNTTSTPTPEQILDAKVSAISINNMSFINGNISVKKGTTVTWTNNDSTAHTVVADDGTFTSSTLTKGGTFSFTFDTAGEFSYHCGIHSVMKGKIIVL